MTKENFINKWAYVYNVKNPYFIADLEAVIATEIAKVKEPQPEPKYPIGGYAPGHYTCRCANCKIEFMGDKRSVQCEPCAVKTTSQPTEQVTDQVTDQEPEQVAEPAEQPAINPIGEPYETFGTLGYKKQQLELNEIERAYERGEKIRQKKWLKNAWIQKLSETESTSDTLTTFANNWDFTTHPENWEIYTEPTEQPSSQAKLDNSFDKERFERMFRAVVASGRTESYEQDFLATNICLEKLDAFYASKEKGGNNE